MFNLKLNKMKSLKFKTNINCTGYLSKVAHFLDEEKGIAQWEVDLRSDERILTVETEEPDREEVQQAVQKAGFNAQHRNTQ